VVGHQRQSTHAERDNEWLGPSHRVEQNGVLRHQQQEGRDDTSGRAPANARGEQPAQPEQPGKEYRVEPTCGFEGVGA